MVEKDSKRGVHLWLVLWKAYAALERQATRSIAALQLGYSDFAVLEALLHKGPTPVNAIGTKVNLTSGSISVAVDRLEERGLWNAAPGRRPPRAHRASHAGGPPTDRASLRVPCRRHGARDVGAFPAEREQAIALLRKLGLSAAAMLRQERP